MTEDQRYTEILRRISKLEQQHETLDGRLTAVELWQSRTTEILLSMREDLREIKSDGVWMRRVIYTAMAGAVVAFIVSGGLAPVTP